MAVEEQMIEVASPAETRVFPTPVLDPHTMYEGYDRSTSKPAGM